MTIHERKHREEKENCKNKIIFTPNGLKCVPVVAHPPEISPLEWTWKPCSPAVRPVICPVIAIPASVSSRFITPDTPAVPSRTAIALF